MTVIPSIMELPPELLIKILEKVERWRDFLGCRLVSKKFKEACDEVLHKKAKIAVQRSPSLQAGYWKERIEEFPGLTMDVLCTRFKQDQRYSWRGVNLEDCQDDSEARRELWDCILFHGYNDG